MITAHLRALGADVGADERVYIRHKLGMKFGKFARSVERVSVRIEASLSSNETRRSWLRSMAHLPGRSAPCGEPCSVVA